MPALSVSAIAPALLREPTSDAVADTASCFHCGAPNPRDVVWRELVEGTPRAFCCAGCLAVSQTITAAGLDGFYASRTESAARLAAEAYHRLAGEKPPLTKFPSYKALRDIG